MGTLMKLRCEDGKICLGVKMEMPTVLLNKSNDINERTTVSLTTMVCMNLKPYNVKIWTVFNFLYTKCLFQKILLYVLKTNSCVCILPFIFVQNSHCFLWRKKQYNMVQCL